MANDKDFKVKNGLTVDSDTLVVDAANSRVGIGTTNPATPLETYGTIRSSAAGTNYGDFNGLSGALYISHRNGADDGAILFGGQGGGAFTEKMRLTPPGNLGIGTSAPVASLDVVSNAQYGNGIDIYDWGDSANGGGVGWSRLNFKHSQSTSSEQAFIYVDQNFNFNIRHEDSGKDIVFQTKPAGGSTTEAMRIRSTGNVGIGTSSPSHQLHLKETGSSGTGLFIEASNETTGYEIARSVSTGLLDLKGTQNSFSGFTFSTTDGSGVVSERMRIANNGNVGIGTSSTSGLLTAVTDANSTSIFSVGVEQSGGNTRYLHLLSPSDRDDGNSAFRFDTANSYAFRVDGTDRLTIDAGGKVLVGYTSSNGSSYNLQVNSQIFSTSSSIATPSDQRYKENVIPLTDAIDTVKALNPVQFDWKEHPVHEFDRSASTIGFIAQEVQAALANKPWLNSLIKSNDVVIEPQQTDEDGNVIAEAVMEEFLGIAEGNLIAVLTAAIQEQQTQIEALEARLSALESA